MKSDEQGFTVKNESDYIHLVTWGVPSIDNVAEPATAALDLAHQHGIHKLMDDIREVDVTKISVHVQVKGTPLLWKMRDFKRVAILVKHDELGSILHSTLKMLDIGGNIRGFYDEAEAIAWLRD